MKTKKLIIKPFVSMTVLCFFINYLAGCHSTRAVSWEKMDWNKNMHSVQLKNGKNIPLDPKKRPAIDVIENAVVGKTKDMIAVAYALDDLACLFAVSLAYRSEEPRFITPFDFLNGQYNATSVVDKLNRRYTFDSTGGVYRDRIAVFIVTTSDGRILSLPVEEIESIDVPASDKYKNAAGSVMFLSGMVIWTVAIAGFITLMVFVGSAAGKIKIPVF